jgi:hypothetical protein
MIVIDDFIKDKPLLEEIKNSKSFFNNPGNILKNPDEKYPNYKRMWWDGWWNSPADTPKKKLIESIFRYNPLAQDKSIQDKIKIGAGFEYYTDKLGPNESFDELNDQQTHDMVAWDQFQKFTPPMYGCIYFPLDYPINGGFVSLEPREGYHEVLQPIYNRLIMFSTGQINQSIRKVFGGTLNTFNVHLYYEETESYKQGLTIKDK